VSLTTVASAIIATIDLMGLPSATT